MLLHRVLTGSWPLLSLDLPYGAPSVTNFSELSPLFATLTRNWQRNEKSDLLTPFFSTKRSHSFSLFFTLKKLSRVFATLTKTRGGGTSPPQKKMGPAKTFPTTWRPSPSHCPAPASRAIMFAARPQNL